MQKPNMNYIKSGAEDVWRSSLLLLRLFVIYLLLFVAEFFAVMLFPTKITIILILSMIVNVIFIFKVMNYGFKQLRDSHKFERIFSLVYGVVCYLCLIFQFAVLFYIFYLTVDGGGVIPKEVMKQLVSLQNIENNEKVFQEYVSPVFAYVFPGFYKFPSNATIFSIVQYYIGKFTDLFILAYIVEAIRKRTGLK